MNDPNRYSSVPTAEKKLPDGRSVVYYRRRWIPQPEEFAVRKTIQVREQDRLDNLAYTHLGDPFFYWLLCDANRALKPEELEVKGKTLRIPLPAGVPAPLDDES